MDSAGVASTERAWRLFVEACVPSRIGYAATGVAIRQSKAASWLEKGVLLYAYIFVSYSRDDEPFITQIVRLLRAAIAGVPSVEGNLWEFVFQDTDHIIPGKDWKDQIDSAISNAERLFVFWCEHSSRSSQVMREYELGISKNKIVIPVLIDDTPLPESLSHVHGVDLRELRIHGPKIRYVFPLPGERSEFEVIAEEFSSALGIDPHLIMQRMAILKFQEAFQS